jgi:hypothetical protein
MEKNGDYLETVERYDCETDTVCLCLFVCQSLCVSVCVHTQDHTFTHTHNDKTLAPGHLAVHMAHTCYAHMCISNIYMCAQR